MFGMGVVGVQGLLDNSMIWSRRMLILFLEGCITASVLWVPLMTWHGWGLRMNFFQLRSFTSLWQVGVWSLSRTVQCGTLGPLQELVFLFGRQIGLEY